MQWEIQDATKIFNLPLPELLYQAQTVHRENFKNNEIQVSTLLSIKTGKCSEDCSYCPQSAHYNTDVEKEPLLLKEQVVEAAKGAKAAGSTRFCMGAAWRGPNDRDLPIVCDMIKEVKELGLETCATLGLLKDGQAETLKESGLDYYNHNIDTSPEYYKEIITTRKFEDRIDTLSQVRASGMSVCSGGILGMGESNEDRIQMLVELTKLEKAPESVPINQLIPIPGTPLEGQKDVDPFDFIRTVALARIMMPESHVRLSAGREEMTDEMQALCFSAGANSIFYGETLLTAKNPVPEQDDKLFSRLGLKKEALKSQADQCCSGTDASDAEQASCCG